jgi:hypothetical protein
MFKRFLEFLKGDSDRETFEGSYLSHLLDVVEPSVVDALEDCPQHDPLLLVVVEILRTTSDGRWGDQEVRSPLVDAESPVNEPPPPPDNDTSSPSTLDITEDVEQMRRDLVGDIVDEDEEPSNDDFDEHSGAEDDPSASEETSPTSSSGDAPDDPPPAPPDEPDVPPSDEFEENRREDQLGYKITSTVEVDTPHRPDAPRAGRGDGPRLDAEPVLQAGRVFLGVLIENDRLPVDMQMEVEDIEGARDLLLGYFLGADDVGQQARAMLETVEEKFSEGLYSQAAILLELFESDRTTRIENDRNLFYDEMILRFGEHQRHGMEPGDADELVSHLETAREDASGEDELFEWLAESSFVSFDILARDLDELERWEDVAAGSSRHEVVEDFTSVIPPERWRRPSEFSRPLIDLVDDYLSPDRIETYVLDHVKTCYFILRAMGDTGLEPYLDVFFDWVEGTFDVDGVALMPPLYQEMTANERLIEDIFGELYGEHFAERADAVRDEWTRSDLESGLDHFYDMLDATDLETLRPGHYNLGGFVLDDLFDLEYPSAEFAFNMHRLS